MIPDINIDVKAATRGLYVVCRPDNHLKVICNFCGDLVVFYEGVDFEMPDSDWMEKGIIHLSTKHSGGF